jgi:hypothetical protein
LYGRSHGAAWSFPYVPRLSLSFKWRHHVLHWGSGEKELFMMMMCSDDDDNDLDVHNGGGQFWLAWCIFHSHPHLSTHSPIHPSSRPPRFLLWAQWCYAMSLTPACLCFRCQYRVLVVRCSVLSSCMTRKESRTEPTPNTAFSPTSKRFD